MMSRKSSIISVAAVVASLSTSGCAVYMAASGDARTIPSNQGLECEQGKEPSTGWAVGHAVMDVLTFGLWEIVGTPIELGRSATQEETVYCKHAQQPRFGQKATDAQPDTTPTTDAN